MRVTVLGYLCRDHNILPDGTSRETVGGKGLFVAAAMSRAGQTVDLITWIPETDLDLLSAFGEYDVTTQVIPIPTGTVNTNTHLDETTVATTKFDPYVITPKDFTPAMVEALTSSDLVHLAPDIQEKISLATIQWLRNDLGLTISADIGKYYRQLQPDGRLVPRYPWSESAQYLPYFDTIFLSHEDVAPLFAAGESPLSIARMLAADGPQEIIITLGDQGAFVLEAQTNDGFDIPAFAPATIVDPTGAGDTFIGVFLAARLATQNLLQAGKLGAMAASLKLAYAGPLQEPGETIEQRLLERS